MSRTLDAEGAETEAEALEREYDWAKVAELYEEALRAVGTRDFLRRGRVQERIGYCLYRAAFQSESQEEFRRCMLSSAEAYEEAAGLFDGLEDSTKHTRTDSCTAMASYVKSFLVEGSCQNPCNAYL